MSKGTELKMDHQKWNVQRKCSEKDKMFECSKEKLMRQRVWAPFIMERGGFGELITMYELVKLMSSTHTPLPLPLQLMFSWVVHLPIGSPLPCFLFALCSTVSSCQFDTASMKGKPLPYKFWHSTLVCSLRQLKSSVQQDLQVFSSLKPLNSKPKATNSSLFRCTRTL